jgi:hypothetical protein
MKRITIVAVLALFSAVASTGCLGQSSTSTDEETAESEQSSGRALTDEEQSASFIRGPSQTLELNLHPNGEAQGPHPEPWLWQWGPHPEPWNGNIGEPDPNADPNAPNGTKP